MGHFLASIQTALFFIKNILRILTMPDITDLAAENAQLKQQLMTLTQGRQRAPQLLTIDKFIIGYLARFMSKDTLKQCAIVIKPATILKFHHALKQRKYRLLFSNKTPKAKPGPKGPSQDIIEFILDIKRLNPSYGTPRIALHVKNVFGIEINKDVVRRILNRYHAPNGSGPHQRAREGPSWLTFLGHAKDSLWSLDFFKAMSITLKTHTVMVVMDHYTRRLIGFAAIEGHVDGKTACVLFNRIRGSQTPPEYLSTDNDVVFNYHQWQANLRILDVQPVKSIPYTPTSHPFIERVIGTTRREFLDHVLFSNAQDLELKLEQFKDYYNQHRMHYALDGVSPLYKADNNRIHTHTSRNVSFRGVCRGLYKVPVFD